MTPKQKAKELVDRYFDMKWQSYSHKKTSIKSMTKAAAKQCALIAIEMLKQEELSHFDSAMLEAGVKPFWQQVKEEINTL